MVGLIFEKSRQKRNVQALETKTFIIFSFPVFSNNVVAENVCSYHLRLRNGALDHERYSAL